MRTVLQSLIPNIGRVVRPGQVLRKDEGYRTRGVAKVDTFVPAGRREASPVNALGLRRQLLAKSTTVRSDQWRLSPLAPPKVTGPLSAPTLLRYALRCPVSLLAHNRPSF